VFDCGVFTGSEDLFLQVRHAVVNTGFPLTWKTWKTPETLLTWKTPGIFC